MSIPDVFENINREAGHKTKRTYLKWSSVEPYILPLSLVLSAVCSVFLGNIWQKINSPSPILIECSEDVKAGLMAISTPIPTLKRDISTSTEAVSYQKSIKRTFSEAKRRAFSRKKRQKNK